MHTYDPIDWRPIRPEDLHLYLIEPQLKLLIDYTYEAKSIVELIIQDVGVMVRSFIYASKQNIRIDDRIQHIPPQLRQATIYLVLEALQSRIPGLDLTTDQKNNADQARATLKMVQQGIIRISSALSPVERINEAGLAHYYRMKSLEAAQHQITRQQLHRL